MFASASERHPKLTPSEFSPGRRINAHTSPRPNGASNIWLATPSLAPGTTSYAAPVSSFCTRQRRFLCGLRGRIASEVRRVDPGAVSSGFWAVVLVARRRRREGRRIRLACPSRTDAGLPCLAWLAAALSGPDSPRVLIPAWILLPASEAGKRHYRLGLAAGCQAGLVAAFISLRWPLPSAFMT